MFYQFLSFSCKVCNAPMSPEDIRRHKNSFIIIIIIIIIILFYRFDLALQRIRTDPLKKTFRSDLAFKVMILTLMRLELRVKLD